MVRKHTPCYLYPFNIFEVFYYLVHGLLVNVLKYNGKECVSPNFSELQDSSIIALHCLRSEILQEHSLRSPFLPLVFNWFPPETCLRGKLLQFLLWSQSSVCFFHALSKAPVKKKKKFFCVKELVGEYGFILWFELIQFSSAEKAMTPHSSTLAWKIPWTEEPGRLQSMGSLRVRHY